jgi:uncharacterized protein (TIGR01244 family)
MRSSRWSARSRKEPTLKRIDERTIVAGQIHPEEVAALGAVGVTMIINNRPDGEEPGQPPAAELEAAALKAGIAYRDIPVPPGGLSRDLVDAMAQALDEAPGTVLAFCRSGTRSTYLWALARSQQGAPGDELIERAAAAGYDLSPLARFFR